MACETSRPGSFLPSLRHLELGNARHPRATILLALSRHFVVTMAENQACFEGRLHAAWLSAQPTGYGLSVVFLLPSSSDFGRVAGVASRQTVPTKPSSG